jgi:ABC-type multidrug transport system fused ATPase/permease subunit
MQELSGEKVGDMMSRMIGDVEQVGESVRTTITETWDTVLLILSHFIACMFYSPKITLLASIPIPIVIFIAQLLRHPLYNLSQKSRKAASAINVHLQHNVSGIALLRLFGLEETDNKKFTKLLNDQLKWNVAASALQSAMMPLYILLATSGIILVVGMGGEYVVNGYWTIGMFTAYLAMFTAMAVRANVAGRVMNTWHGAKASWDRIREKFMHDNSVGAGIARPPEYITSVIMVTDTDAQCAPLRVNSLTFTYPFSNEPCLKNVSFTANKGEIIGITGSVGSGKSALAAALSGLFPYDGEVLIDGVHLNALNDSRNEKIAYMDSEHFVFSDDVEFNVTLDRKDGDLEKALSLAAMDSDVNGFENGVHTRLMERGLRISGGQRQRISLARAWYSQSEILILDDPFSAIDINMEQEIMDNMRENLGDRIVLLFSHRLATFKTADKIIVIDKGKTKQIGTHDDLMNQQGLYKDIYTAQEFMRTGDGVDEK